jgi:hypothetical protein
VKPLPWYWGLVRRGNWTGHEVGENRSYHFFIRPVTGAWQVGRVDKTTGKIMVMSTEAHEKSARSEAERLVNAGGR